MATWKDGSEYAPQEAPMGFATPVAPPLSTLVDVNAPAFSQPTTTLTAPETPPEGFEVPANDGPDLDTVAPTPEQNRNPMEPFISRSDDGSNPDEPFDPRKPLLEIEAASPDESGSLATNFPPPTGAPVAAPHFPPPTGNPVGPAGYPHRQPLPGQQQAAGPWGYPAQPGRPVPVNPGTPPPTVGQFVHQPQPGMPTGYPPVPQGGYPRGPRPNPYQNPNFAMGPQGYPGNQPYNEYAELQQTRARFFQANWWGRFGIVLKEVSWPAILCLVGAIFFPVIALVLIPVSYLLITQTKVGQPAISRVFQVGFGAAFLIWLIGILTQYGGVWGFTYEDFYSLYRLIAIVLIVAAVALGWRDLNRRA